MNQPQLISAIPGIIVKLTPNPLRCSTTLTESALREVTLHLVLENVMEHTYSAKFELENENNNDMLERHETALKDLNYIIEPWLAEGTISGFERWKTLGNNIPAMIEGLNEQHGGDCTSAACSCLRCHMDVLIGVDTLPVSKSVGHRLWGEYIKSGDATNEDVLQEEVQQKHLSEYRKKYPSTTIISEVDILLYKPKWDAAAKAAKEYYAQHRRLNQEQEESTRNGK